MTTPPTPAPEPTPTPQPPGLFTPEQEAALSGVFKKALSEYAEENKPPPDKTKKPAGSFLDTLFGS